MATKTSKKPVKATKAPKPTHAVCLSCPGKLQFVKHRIKDMQRNENGRLVCDRCYAPAPKAKKECVRTDKWYVIQVDPGSETQVRADIMKQVRIRNLEGQVRRVMSPSYLVERVGPRAGEVLASGYVMGPATAPTYDLAREAGFAAARGIYLKQNPETELDDVPDFMPPGMKISTFPGVQPGTGRSYVEWKVREYNDLETVRKVVKGRKYPGYMLINMDWNVETERLVRKTRNVWTVLLDPVVTGHLIKITERTSKFAKPGQNLGFNWRVCEPDGGVTVAKGWADSKLAARAKAESAKAVAEEFKPTELASREAAEALIAQQAVNQILKDKEELNKAVCNLKPGDRVRVKAGAFRDCRGEVSRVVRNPKDRSDIQVACKLSLMGRDVPLTVPHHDLERLTPGDRG